MSLKYIYDFQFCLYEKLKKDESLNQKIKGVYINIQKDPPAPSILIGNMKATNISRHDISAYNLNFDISIFGKSKAPAMLLDIADIINNLLAYKRIEAEEFAVLFLRQTGLDFAEGHDLITNKITMRYIAHLEQKMDKINVS